MQASGHFLLHVSFPISLVALSLMPDSFEIVRKMFGRSCYAVKWCVVGGTSFVWSSGALGGLQAQSQSPWNLWSPTSWILYYTCSIRAVPTCCSQCSLDSWPEASCGEHHQESHTKRLQEDPWGNIVLLKDFSTCRTFPLYPFWDWRWVWVIELKMSQVTSKFFRKYSFITSSFPSTGAGRADEGWKCQEAWAAGWLRVLGNMCTTSQHFTTHNTFYINLHHKSAGTLGDVIGSSAFAAFADEASSQSEAEGTAGC